RWGVIDTPRGDGNAEWGSPKRTFGTQTLRSRASPAPVIRRKSPTEPVAAMLPRLCTARGFCLVFGGTRWDGGSRTKRIKSRTKSRFAKGFSDRLLSVRL